jgi:xylulose-5-phosphate/fructose-6-phosphate phosphoketolase
MPDFRDYAVDVPSPGGWSAWVTRTCSGVSCANVAKLNSERRNFRVFGLDETLANGLEASSK